MLTFNSTCEFSEVAGHWIPVRRFINLLTSGSIMLLPKCYSNLINSAGSYLKCKSVDLAGASDGYKR